MEPVDDSFEPATLGRRFAALCYDLLLLGALVFCFTLLLLTLRGGREIAAGTWWFELSLVGLSMLFFCGFWVKGGQTLGMRAWRIRIVTQTGAPLRWSEALVRFWLAAAGALLLGAGFWSSWLDAERRTWHDRISHTRVRRERAPSAPARSIR